MEQNSNSGQKYIIIAIVAFLIGFGVAWFWLTKVPTSSLDTGKEDAVTEMSADDKGLLVVEVMASDQTAGVAVQVDSVSVNRLSWVAIHEENEMGIPGNILGAKLLEAGVYDSQVVELLRGTLAGKTYYALIHDEDGDRSFDPKKDLPLIDDAGQPVLSTFQTLEE